MRCLECGTLTKIKHEGPSGDSGVRRTRVCPNAECGAVISTLEVRVEFTNGRDAARRQEAEILGKPYVPSKNLHSLRMEEHAKSPDFKWAVVTTYPCTVPNLAKVLGFSQSQIDTRLKFLVRSGILERINPKKVGGPFEYRYLPSHKRQEPDETRSGPVEAQSRSTH